MKYTYRKVSLLLQFPYLFSRFCQLKDNIDARITGTNNGHYLIFIIIRISVIVTVNVGSYYRILFENGGLSNRP